MSRLRTGLGFTLIALSLVVLCAHFVRGLNLALAVPCLLGLGLMWIPRRWAIAPVQLLLGLGALEWGATLYLGALKRIAEGRPWTRMAIILGVVGLIAALSAVLPFFGGLGRYYRSASAPDRH